MTNYFKPQERESLFRRIECLTPTMASRDRAVTGHQLICHLNDTLRDILGEQRAVRTGNAFHRTVLKWLAFHLIPWPEQQPKNAIALKAFIGQRAPATFEQDHAQFVMLLKAFDERWRASTLPPHPIFGALSKNEWGDYMFLHLDHHLATFGIHGERTQLREQAK
jgi:hypothetical protein